MKNLNSYIDHTLLRTTATEADIIKICDEALIHSFASVCAPPALIDTVVKKLKGSDVKTCTVIGFPNGYNSIEAKVFEIQDALSKGAQEIDVVLNQSFIKDEKWHDVENEIKLFSENKKESCLKIIIESGTLEKNEIKKICEITNSYAVDFLKTSTGFADKGATTEAVEIMRLNLRSGIKIKASGGIRTKEDALKFIKLGADRLGCSSSVEIVS